MRQSYRCAVDESHREAKLCAAGAWTPVELIDESAGGFGVVSEQPLGVSAGDVVQLRVDGELFETRVVYIEEQTPDDERAGPSFRLGLKRVGVYFGDAIKPLPWYKFFFKRYRHRPYGSLGPLLLAAFVFAMVIGVAPVIVAYFMDTRGIGGPSINSRAERDPDDGIRRRDANDERPRPEVEPSGSIFEDSERKATVRRLPSLNFIDSKPSPTQNSSNNKRDTSFVILMEYAKLKGSIGKWRDQVLAAIADLTEQLGLSDPQKKDVDDLLRQTDEAIARFDVPDPEYSPQTVAREKSSILESAYAKLMQIFTEAQRIEWNELVKKWSAEADTPPEKKSKPD